jgi:hypothetical protein
MKNEAMIMNKLKFLVLLMTLGLTTSTMAGSLYLSGHDVILHGGQNGYWRVILDYLRGAGTPEEIAEADYDIAFLKTSGNDIPPGWGGTITTYNPTTLDDAGWAEVFSKDVIVVPWAFAFNESAQIAFNARKLQFETYFNADGDLWMSSNIGAPIYYDVLPESVLSSGDGISGSDGFEATAEGTAIGILSSHINGFATHNNFTTVASELTVFEIRTSTGNAISIGVSDAKITDGEINTDDAATLPVPTLTFWGLLLLLMTIAGVAYKTLGSKRGSRS